MSLVLKGTLVLGYVDVTAAGCRTLLGAVDNPNYEMKTWHLRNLDDGGVSVTSSMKHQRDSHISAQEIESLPVTQAFSHTSKDVSLLVINKFIEDDVAHVIAEEILDLIASGPTKEFIVLSSLPTGIENKSVRIIDKGSVVDAFSKFKCNDPFLNSIIQFSLAERLPLSVLVAEGRKACNITVPNKVDGSLQCITSLNESLNQEHHLDLRLESTLRMVYSRASKEDVKENLMFL